MAGLLPGRVAWLVGLGMLSACARTAPQPLPLAQAVGIIQRAYIDPVSLDRLLQSGVDGIAHITPPLTQGQITALRDSARVTAPDDAQRAEAFARAVAQAGDDPTRPRGATDLVEAALLGMTTDLDPHSSYATERRISAARNVAPGSVGLELQVDPISKVTVVYQPMGSPANQAGIKPGDVLTAVGGRAVSGLPLDDVVDLLRGSVGSPVVLDLTRPGRPQPLTVTATRQVVRLSVRWSLLDRVIYLFPNTFQPDTDLEVRKAVSAARDAAGGPLEGAILDLRGNTGGLLDAVVIIARHLLPPGRLVVTLRGRHPEETYRTAPTGRSGRDDLLTGVPLIVLVDDTTAAGAEILAGALQDNGRAVIAGSPTFGFGTVQTVIPVITGLGAMRITTSKVYLPSGRGLQRQGVAPDVPLHAGDAVLREAQIPGSLPGEAGVGGPPARPGLAAIRAQIAVLPAYTGRIDPDRPGSDPDVVQALKILRIMGSSADGP